MSAELTIEQKIDEANTRSVETMLGGDPVLVDVIRAGDAIPALDGGKLILHAGPPVEWDRMCGDRWCGFEVRYEFPSGPIVLSTTLNITSIQGPRP